jgi:hypothetical protein
MTINSDGSIDIFQRFACNLDDRELLLGNFQQDWTVCHRYNRVRGKIMGFMGSDLFRKHFSLQFADMVSPDVFLLSVEW